MRKSSKIIPAKNVDEYLDRCTKEVKAELSKLRKLIRKAAPEATEVISFHIPMYKFNGPLVGFAAYENHCSFYVANKNILKIFAEELQPFKATGITIHFTPDKPLPAILVQKIVKLRMKENEE